MISGTAKKSGFGEMSVARSGGNLVDVASLRRTFFRRGERCQVSDRPAGKFRQSCEPPNDDGYRAHRRPNGEMRHLLGGSAELVEKLSVFTVGFLQLSSCCGCDVGTMRLESTSSWATLVCIPLIFAVKSRSSVRTMASSSFRCRTCWRVSNDLAGGSPAIPIS